MNQSRQLSPDGCQCLLRHSVLFGHFHQLGPPTPCDTNKATFPLPCGGLGSWETDHETGWNFILSYPGDFKSLTFQNFFEPSHVPMILWPSQGKWPHLSISCTSVWHSGHCTNSCLMNGWHAADGKTPAVLASSHGIFISLYLETHCPITRKIFSLAHSSCVKVLLSWRVSGCHPDCKAWEQEPWGSSCMLS